MRETWPEARVTVACGHLPAPLFEGFSNVERVIPMTKRARSGHWVDLWKEVIGTRWDVVVDLRNSAVSRLIRTKRRYIFGSSIDKSKHKVEQMAAVMKLNVVPAPKLYFTSTQMAFADQVTPAGKTILGVGPSANWIGKTWPKENFIEIVEWLTAPDGLFPGAYVAVFAAPGEEVQARPVLESVPVDKRIDVIAKGNPVEAAACLSRCAFFIGNDSGLMHAAAACGVPTVGVFGPSYPHLYRPWGEHTAFVRTPETFDELVDFDGYDPKTLDRTLMGSLTMQAVQSAIESLFDKQNPVIARKA